MAEAKRKGGRPKGSGMGLEVQVGLRLTSEVAAIVDEAAEEAGEDRASMVRVIVDKWAERQRKGKAKR